MGLGDRMALTEGGSFVVSSIVSLLLFSGMQVYKTALASSQLMTILAGFTGSLLFVFLLTAVGNLEKSVFGFNFQTKLGEVVLHGHGHVRCRHGAQGLGHNLSAVLHCHDLVPQQDLPGHLRPGCTSSGFAF